MTAGSATNQEAAETTPSADQNAKEEAAENTPAAESDEPSGETVAERRECQRRKDGGGFCGGTSCYHHWRRIKGSHRGK